MRTQAEIENSPFLTLRLKALPDADNAAVGRITENFLPTEFPPGFFSGGNMKEQLTRKQKNRRIAESALMIALSTVLSVLPVVNLPFGGSVTLFSQVPVILVSYRYGVKWGIKTGLVFAVIQMITGFENFSYVSGIAAYAVLAMADYIVAFSVLGTGGMFKNKLKNQAVCLAFGSAVVTSVRFLCHFISGVTIWKAYAGDLPVWRYSLVYNGSFMIPELIITVLGVVIISSVFDLRSETIKTKRNNSKK